MRDPLHPVTDEEEIEEIEIACGEAKGRYGVHPVASLFPDTGR